MLCPKCGQANADAAQFCTACGQALAVAPQAPGSPEGDASLPPSIDMAMSGSESASSAGIPTETQPALPVQPQISPAIPFGSRYGGAAASPAQQIVTPTYNYPHPAPYTALCRVCGSPIPPGGYACPRCGTPAGMIVNAGDSTANTYIPAGQTGYAPAANSSGRKTTVPAELRQGWNWGAAFLTYPWAIAHGVWWYVTLITSLVLGEIALLTAQAANSSAGLAPLSQILLLIYGMLYVIFRIYFGVNGTQIAWKCHRFESAYQCLEAQDRWKSWGIAAALMIGGVLLIFVLFFVFAIVVASTAAG